MEIYLLNKQSCKNLTGRIIRDKYKNDTYIDFEAVMDLLVLIHQEIQ